MQFKIFISSVQREFAAERKLLADYIRKDAILCKFFDVFLFEEVPAQERSAAEVYLGEVDACDLYLGLLGESYGNVDAQGVSATEREYERAEQKHKDRICFVKQIEGTRDAREARFVSRVNAERTRRSFANWDDLRTGVYAALANYLESKDLINMLPFDSSKTAGVQLKDLGVGKVRTFVLDAREKRSFKLTSRASVMDVLTALELVDDAGRICNSAALLFGKRPQRFFPTSEVKCAWFFGDHVEKPMADYQIYEGDVFELADQATAFVMSHISRQIGRHETNAAPTTFELPRDAVFEGIVNAICHRDYTSNASVQVMLFRNRLEIMSPGKLPKGMTVPLLHRRHRSIPVNPLLARGMFYRGYIEKVGSGTGDMLEKCRLAGTPEPEWIEEDDGFTVVLKRQTSQVGLEDVPATIQKTPRKPPESPQDTPQKIITAMRANPLITRNELAALVGLKPEGVKSAIAKLKASGAIRRVGPDKGGHWEVVAPSA